ncbi:Calcium-dependent phosphotriesterase superfamily protein [Trifolium repens]|nr:Calcium-dependent phosphotriesterase superfamily protein [Trifolium repens]
MSIHSSKHSLIIFFILIQISSPIIKVFARNTHVINFRSPNLYPESLAWDSKKQHFLVGSLRHRTISSISDAGIVETLITDTSLPENVTVLGLTVDSRNNRILAVIHALQPLPPFNALAAYDLNSGNRLFLSILPSDEPALANDVAVDSNGNAYVTNSFGNFIWKINDKGEASIFSKSRRFTEHPVDRDTPYSFYGLNGIAYVSSGGYLLVTQTNTGKIFKVDVDDGTVRHVLLNKDLTCPDGVVLRSDGVVLVVSPELNKLWLLKSNNGWGEGVVYDEIDLGDEGCPTSVVARERNKMYVLFGYMSEGILGKVERESFKIEEIKSPKESEDENIWIYVMIGFGLVYFLYWRFQMGQLVKNMNKKIN